MSLFNEFDDPMHGDPTVGGASLPPSGQQESHWHLTKEFMLFQLVLSIITLVIVLIVSISGNTRLTRMEVRASAQWEVDKGQNREIAVLRDTITDRLGRIEDKLDNIAERLPR